MAGQHLLACHVSLGPTLGVGSRAQRSLARKLLVDVTATVRVGEGPTLPVSPTFLRGQAEEVRYQILLVPSTPLFIRSSVRFWSHSIASSILVRASAFSRHA